VGTDTNDNVGYNGLIKVIAWTTSIITLQNAADWSINIPGLQKVGKKGIAWKLVEQNNN
jgi:hypothetical protein